MLLMVAPNFRSDNGSNIARVFMNPRPYAQHHFLNSTTRKASTLPNRSRHTTHHETAASNTSTHDGPKPPNTTTTIIRAFCYVCLSNSLESSNLSHVCYVHERTEPPPRYFFSNAIDATTNSQQSRHISKCGRHNSQ